VRTSRVQAAIKILKSSAEEFYIDEKPKARKAAKSTTVKKAAKKSNK